MVSPPSQTRKNTSGSARRAAKSQNTKWKIRAAAMAPSRIQSTLSANTSRSSPARFSRAMANRKAAAMAQRK